MPIPLIEHTASGLARCQIRETDAAATIARPFRDLPVVSAAVPSLEAGPWFAGAVGCLGCGEMWVAVAPVRDPDRAGRGLECPFCGVRESAPFAPAWCSSCGYDHMVAQAEDAPVEGGACFRCDATSVLVER